MFTSAVYGCGLALLWKRESGFVKSFVQDAPSWRRLLVGHAIACSLLLAASLLVLSVFAVAMSGIDWGFMLKLSARAVLWCFVFSLLCGGFVLVPLTARSATAAINILIIPFTVLTIYARTSGSDSSFVLRLADFINPLSISAKMMFMERHDFLSTVIFVPLCAVGIFISLTRFRPNAVVHRLKVLLEGVSYRYKNGPSILNDVSLELEGPGLYGVIGPNGSGKTTFFDLVMGARQPDKGRISLEGIATKSFLPQRTEFSDLLSLRENLELLSAVRG